MNNDADKDKQISLVEAAELYGFNPQYLSQLAKKGRLRAQKFGNTYITTLADMEEFIQSRKKIGAYREDIQIQNWQNLLRMSIMPGN